MKELIKYVLFASLAIINVSCFQIIEELTFNEDDSGNYKLTVNLSQSKSKVKSVLLLDSINGHAVPSREEMTVKFDKLVADLNADPGIDQAKVNADWENCIYTISCHFNKVEALNQSLKKLGENSGIKDSTLYMHSVYEKDPQKFVREGNYNVKEAYRDLKEDDKKIFREAEFIGVYKFASAVKNVSNPKARTSKNGKAVMVKAQFLDLILGKADIANEITF